MKFFALFTLVVASLQANAQFMQLLEPQDLVHWASEADEISLPENQFNHWHGKVTDTQYSVLLPKTEVVPNSVALGPQIYFSEGNVLQFQHSLMTLVKAEARARELLINGAAYTGTLEVYFSTHEAQESCDTHTEGTSISAWSTYKAFSIPYKEGFAHGDVIIYQPDGSTITETFVQGKKQ